ncbi:MAG TPA: hypothetical protein VM821_05955 [Abditibacteriaceae bacterium]|jgi:hypothetical protein|nr:hypothetical protein [Abditibacteriaceae bacterium]
MNETNDQKNDATPDSDVSFRRDESEGQRTASRDDEADAPQSRPEKGILGQTTPDVATGSTPVTRHD